MKNANEAFYERLTTLERLAVIVTRSVGSMGFFLFLLVWSIVWISWNMFAPAHFRFDPFPAFVFWLFIANFIQLVLTPLLLVGQDLLAKRDAVRANADFEINKIAEEEVELVLAKTDEILKRIDAIEQAARK